MTWKDLKITKCGLPNILLGCIISLAYHPAMAESQPLQQIQNKIYHLRDSLNQAQSQQQQLQQQLQYAEMKMGELAVELEQTQSQIKTEKKALSHTSQQQTQDQNLINLQQQTLAEQSRAIYALSKHNYLQILLNQQNPATFERILTYYGYVNRQRTQLIKEFNTTLLQVNHHKVTQQRALEKLTHLEQQQHQQEQALFAAKKQREQLIQNLNHQITDKDQQLKILLANKSALEQVVKHLQKKYVNALHFILPHHAGKLPWPTAGKIIESFGTAIAESQLRSTGVIIKANQGQPVYAVAAGQVVFSKWMAGYGLLVIIDHENGLMSIYGRNNSLYKRVGDHVRAGELIATVGNSGGYTEPGLYFALREDGRPVNPAQWCG